MKLLIVSSMAEKEAAAVESLPCSAADRAIHRGARFGEMDPDDPEGFVRNKRLKMSWFIECWAAEGRIGA